MSENIIEVNDVTMEFNMSKEKVDSLKEYVIKMAKKQLHFEQFLALKNITFKDSMIEAPKTFRRSSNIKLYNTNMPNADETLWNCSDIYLENVSAKGNYFGMNSKNIKVKNFNLNGNYLFDGGENIEIDHAYLISKDSFWNCRHVVVKNSTIIGEYIGWNSEDVTFINCTIDSNQGFCYMKNLKLINCKLLNTDLAFEFVSDINAEVKSEIDSVKNCIARCGGYL